MRSRRGATILARYEVPGKWRKRKRPSRQGRSKYLLLVSHVRLYRRKEPIDRPCRDGPPFSHDSLRFVPG